MRGRKIYFHVTTGERILELGDGKDLLPTTIEQDIADFIALSERNRDTFDVLELAYGDFAQEFAECNGYRVNPETKKLEFSQPVPGEPEAPQIFGKPLTEQIEELKIAQADTNTMLLEFMEATLLP